MFIAQRAAEPMFPGNFGPFKTMVTFSRFTLTKSSLLFYFRIPQSRSAAEAIPAYPACTRREGEHL